MKKTIRRWGIHSTLYAANPWAVIAGSIREQITTDSDQRAAQSFVSQAHEYFRAAEQSSTIETRPLLYYYSFLNLGKAIAIARGRPNIVGRVRHGIAAVDASGHAVSGAELVVQASARDRSVIQVVDELHRALENSPVLATTYPVGEILAQSVVGHRMWREGHESPPKERFIAVDDIRFFYDKGSKVVWSRVYVRRSTLKARERGVAETLRESQLESKFHAVKEPDAARGKAFHTFEQTVPTSYTGRAADVVMDIVADLRANLWETITSARPYRRFYLYLSPANELRMPQWLSAYSTLFWLGSLTRYQPVELLDALDGPLGPFLREFLETQPTQLLYFMASEAKKQDVARAAIV